MRSACVPRLAAILAFMLSWAAPAEAQVTPLTQDWITLQPQGAGFRIRMPPDWEQTTPRMPNTKVVFQTRAGASYGKPGFANCNVVARSMPETARLSQAQIDADVSSGPVGEAEARNAIGPLSEARMRVNDVSQVDNRPAFFIVGSGNRAIANGKVHMVTAVALVLRPGRSFAVGCNAGGATRQEADAAFASWVPVLGSVINSFATEN